MTIEFNAPQGEVPEHIIDFIRDKLMEFYKRDKEISRAEVKFRKQPFAPNGDHVCEIALTIYGDSIMIHRKGDSYSQAAGDVVNEISRKVEEFVKQQKEPPDEKTSTVEV
jgi:ribosome-associated translation inhibitor RaiA